MINLKSLFIIPVIIALVSVALTGCVSKSEYEALQADYAALEAVKQSLATDYEKLNKEHEDLKAEKTILLAEKESLLAENEAFEDKYDELDMEHQALQGVKATLESEKESLQDKYNQLNTQLSDTKADLAEIKDVYPPRDFSALIELQDWLLGNDVSEKPVTTFLEGWYSRALEIQEDALKDGYVISVDYDGPDEEGGYSVFCVTIINGYIWYWDPETDEPFPDPAIDKVK